MNKFFNQLRKIFLKNKKIKIWYHPLYLPELYSHSEIRNVSIKYKTIISFLFKNKMIDPTKVIGPRRVSFNKLGLFHTPSYLESTTQSDFDFSSLGLNLTLGEGESLREAQRRVVSGTVEGMYELAFKNLYVAINISGGLHHAEPDKASGFCLYNDVGVAIKYLHKKKYFGKILIIDLDFHQGNGNLEGLKDEADVFQFSITGTTWRNCSAYSNVKEIILPKGVNDQIYLETLKKNLLPYVDDIKPDLICYICGNDVLGNDPYGTFNLTLDGLFKRDRIVFDLAKNNNIPIQIVLGGGYSPDAWIGNCQFLTYILDEKKLKHLHFSTEDVDQFYTHFLKKWQPEYHSTKNELSFDQNDIFPEINVSHHVQKLFNYYTRGHIEFQMNKLGIYHKLRKKGHHDLWIELFDRPGNQNMIRLKSEINKNIYTLIESVVEIINYKIPMLEDKLRLLNVEWLLAQNPLEPFTLQRPQLPGQDHPGLGISDEILSIFVEACNRFKLDGVIHCPSHYHVAVKAMKHFHYPDPLDDAIFATVRLALDKYSLKDASLIMTQGQLIDSNQQVISINNKKLLYPVSQKLEDYFNSDYYQNTFNNKFSELNNSFSIIKEKLK